MEWNDGLASALFHLQCSVLSRRNMHAENVASYVSKLTYVAEHVPLTNCPSPTASSYIASRYTGLHVTTGTGYLCCHHDVVQAENGSMKVNGTE